MNVDETLELSRNYYAVSNMSVCPLLIEKQKKKKLTKLVANSKQTDSRARGNFKSNYLPSDFERNLSLTFLSFFLRIEHIRNFAVNCLTKKI